MTAGPAGLRLSFEAVRSRAAEGRGSDMPLFVIERSFAEELDPELVNYSEVKLVNDDEGVSWVYSFLSADKKKTYCLYEAPNADAIRAAAERLGLPADVIVPVEQFGPVAAG
jgi:hypothetical protein